MAVEQLFNKVALNVYFNAVNLILFTFQVWTPGIHDSRCLIHYLRYRIILKQSSERRSGPFEVIGMDVWIQKQLPPELLPSPQLEAWLLLRGKLFMSFDVDAFSRFRFNNKKARAVCALLDDAFVHLKPHLEMSEHPNKRKRILLIRKHLRLCLSKLHPAYKKIKRKLIKAGSIASILRLCKPRPKCSFCGVVLTQDCLFMLLDSCPHLTCYGCEPLQDPRYELETLSTNILFSLSINFLYSY